MSLIQLSTRTRIILLLGCGYPILALVSVIALSFCVDKMEGNVCQGLIANIQTIWTLWILCSFALLAMVIFRKREEEPKNQNR